MSSRSILMLAALAGSAYAKTSSSSATANATSTMEVILPLLDSQTVMGSIMGVDATATTFFLTCPTDASALTCGLGDGIELVEGDSVLEVHYTQDTIGTIDVNCAVASNTASCTTTMTTADITITGTKVVASSQVTSTGSTVITNLSTYAVPVTVTAGLEKLSAATIATGGVPRATQNAMLMGAAAMVGGVLLI